MPTFASFSGGESSDSPDPDGHGSQEIDSVRELNRLLESALRMGGDGNTDGSDAPISDGSDGASSEDTADSASWRLDTARRLSSLLSSRNPHNINNDNYSPNNNDESDDNLLLPALRRQSRYWIPLLLSWLKGGIDTHNDSFSSSDTRYSSNNNDNNSLDLPFTANRRRHRQKNAQSSNSSSTPEVPIEALRALTALTQWTARGGDPEGDQTNVDSANKNTAAHVTAGCSPHTPLSTSSQRLLLRHADAVPMIVSLLSSPDAAVHEQAVWILGSIASSGLGATALSPSPQVAAAHSAAAEMTKMMSENGGDGGLDGSASVVVPSAATSSLPASDDSGADDNPPSSTRIGKDKSSVTARDVIFSSGAMAPLLNCLADNPYNVSLHRVGAWCLSSLVEGRYSSSSNSNDSSLSSSSKKQPCAAEEIDILTLLPTMKRMLHIDDAEILTFTCWTLSHLCDGPAYHIAAVIYSETTVSHPKRKLSPANGLVPRLVELLLHPSPKVAKPALRTIGNIVCADCTDQVDQFGNTLPVVDFTEIILECQAVPCLRNLVGHHNREIQKEACWTLSNIAAGTASQIQAVIDSGAIPPLVDLVNNDLSDKEVRSEACWVVLNATSCGNDEQISILIEEGCVSVLGVLLAEPNMVMMALEGIERVLQTEEAQDSEDLYHKSEEELGQRPTIIKCASLIKTVTESPHNSSAVSKRAKRIWEHHFISCALCHNNYSRCRLQDSHFCNECKCHVCSKCDCRVYHLSYQEELWAEDEEKAAESKKNKKSKKQKKKLKMKEKAAEKKKLESRDQAKQQQQQKSSDVPKGADAASIQEKGAATTNNSKDESGKVEPSYENGKAEMKKKGAAASRKTTSSSPSRGTIESDTPSLGNNGGDNDGALDDEDNNSDTNGGQPPIDLVLYLQQTGSIIALAKLMDSLYDNEYEDEDDNNVDAGREQPQQSIDLNHRVLTTQ